MSFIVSYQPAPRTPASEGLHQAVCVDVEDLGLKQTSFGEKHQGMITWQIEEKNPDTGRRQLVFKTYNVSLHKKAKLRIDLETWRGRSFTEEELGGFDLEQLIGVNCQLQIAHNISDEGRAYANVQAIVPAGKGMTKLRAEDYTRKKDRPKEESKIRAIAGRAKPVDEDDDEAVPF